MAVMTSSLVDKSPLDLKASAFAPVDIMAVDADTNGVHNVLFDDQDAKTNHTDHLAQPKPTVNGHNGPMDTSAPAVEPAIEPAVEPAVEPTTHVSGGIDGIAQFLPDSQQDNNSLFGDSDMGSTLANALEAPTSDVRDEPATAEELSTATQATSESTQQVPETQIEPKEEPAADAMDTTADATEDSKPPESSAPPTKPMHDLSIQTDSAAAAAQPDSTQSPAVVDREMEDAPSTGKVRPREDDDDDEPDAKRTKTEDESTNQIDFKVPDVPSQTELPNGNAEAPSESVQESSGVHKAVDYEAWPSSPMTEAQNKFLLERIRNTKKIKVSIAFKDPVNPVALGIPTYPEIVRNPMDLSTMEHKLKEKTYQHIREFMADLDQMIENSELFNNKQHPVTQAGYNLRAYFLKGMGKMPRGSAEEPPKLAKAKKPTVNTAPKPRRESRVAPPTVKSPAAPTPTATSPQAAWPLQQDGTPLIRRDSSTADGRPKREIHRPSKDLPYTNAKPRRKKYQQELKFCESVLTELLKPKYSTLTFPFITPVDPVALNIPSYLKIIKKPMDFGTIERNLKNGVYQSAKDFHNDAQLVFLNCYKFNPEGDAVNKMGHQLEDLFESLWKEKADWLAQHAPAPEHSPSELYSDEDDEDDEEEEEVDPAQAQFLAIQQQIAQLNATAQQLLQQQTSGKRASPKAPSKKKKAVAAPAKRKSLPLAVPPPAKPAKPAKRVKAPAPLSFAQKQEISEGISTLGDADMRRAVQIIRNGCPHLANVHDDEMELDMDEINDETLRELFKFIKSLRGPKGGSIIADDDFEPPTRQVSKQTASRPKKNKPMGKTEQEDNMRKIQEKLQSFQGGASGSSQSPPGELSVHALHDLILTSSAHDASSDDDESSGSESEEE
ncbi:Bromodomain-containing protein [Cucurbitaria berberidis CBS 394.84]|uniref:Bromodomain-containing protein n=1 Tax=Cucurbitaria berberidis CBS 394.84 TaxID=1168544 RepID=A0A9P4GVA6_9PLEO|nr:Bromodomain-containing protein [Cucurbitaria berberidis CBS 394.84]KAF1852010.1 Bromodomain-containing protein [Cucurbitaria berberidis CBS 394.84]